MRPGRLLPLLLPLGLGACAGPAAEQHLAPVYTHLSTSGGGEEYEALAGAVIARRRALDARFHVWGLRPLFLHRPRPADAPPRELNRTRFLYPFGKVDSSTTELDWWLLPVADYRRDETPEGDDWKLIMLPGIYLARLPDGRRASAFFPLGGTVHELFTFERVDFVLWPLFTRTEQQGRVSWHLPWPFIMVRTGPDGGGWRLWPLVGHSWVDDRYDRWFALWPVFNFNRENLKSSPRYHERQWSIFPLYARRTQGSWSSNTVLWPFFGYSSDDATGFWALDAPWPLVRFQVPGDERLVPLPNKQGAYTRRRLWPFYSYYEGDDMVSRWYAWPLVNRRHEEYEDGERDALAVYPFWQQWDREDGSGGRAFRKAWPLYQYEREGEVESHLFPQLSPFWYWPELDDHYAWLYALYDADHGPGVTREHALWGLWRREHDAGERRTYLSGLWSRREYRQEDGPVTEHSLLFGLLRWRDASDGWGLLPPALPGPGWPVARVGAPEEEAR